MYFFLYVGIVGTLLLLVLLILIIVLAKKILISIAIIKEASKLVSVSGRGTVDHASLIA